MISNYRRFVYILIKSSWYNGEMASDHNSNEQKTYFELLAEIGHTKHIGGMAATNRLLGLIDPQAGDAVLDVGCGVGIGPLFLAEHFSCHVLGVDITPRMIDRAWERALRHGVSDSVRFCVSDMHDLPFEENSFDSAVAESVLTFSKDKTVVLAELARVVRPGGMVAFTEAIWVRVPPHNKRDFMARASGMPEGILSHEEWEAVLAKSALEDVVAEAYAITARDEAKSQYGRIQPADYLRTLPGFFRVIRQSRFRKVFRTAAGSMPKDYYDYIGYGVYGGVVR
jgi:SAM-dependent methyltransferase